MEATGTDPLTILKFYSLLLFLFLLFFLLFLIGISAPMIVDIDWRLDYSIRSKHGGRNNIPMYFVCLKVKDRGLIRNIEMIASLEEMQDLLASVRDAVKQVERDEY